MVVRLLNGSINRFGMDGWLIAEFYTFFFFWYIRELNYEVLSWFRCTVMRMDGRERCATASSFLGGVLAQ